MIGIFRDMHPIRRRRPCRLDWPRASAQRVADIAPWYTLLRKVIMRMPNGYVCSDQTRVRVVADAVTYEPVSSANSLLAGKNTGKISVSARFADFDLRF